MIYERHSMSGNRQELEACNPDGHKTENGSIEAGLVLIPTTLFFLMVIQIIVAGSWQVLERSNLHNLVIRSNITNEEIEFVANRPEKYQSNSSLEGNSSLVESDREIFITQENSVFGKIKRYELTSSVPLLGDFFKKLAPGLFKVKNYAVTVT